MSLSKFGLTPCVLYMNGDFQDAGETHIAYRGAIKDLFPSGNYIRKYTLMIPPTLIYMANRTHYQINVVVIDDIHGTLSSILREQLLFLRNRKKLRIYSVVPETDKEFSEFTAPFYKLDDTPGVTTDSIKSNYMSRIAMARATIDIFAYTNGMFCSHDRRFDTASDDIIASIGNFKRGTRLFVDIIVMGDPDKNTFGEFLTTNTSVFRSDITPMSVIRKTFSEDRPGEYRLFQVFVFRKKQSKQTKN